MLNSFLFPKDKKIKNIEYLPREIAKYPENLKRYSLDSIRVDILCKCIIKKNNDIKKEENKVDDNEDEEDEGDEDNEDEEDDENKDEEENDNENEEDDENEDDYKDDGDKKQDENEIMLIDFKIQIGFGVENSRKFINYAKRLEKRYNKKIIVSSLIYGGVENPIKNKGSITSIDKKIYLIIK